MRWRRLGIDLDSHQAVGLSAFILLVIEPRGAWLITGASSAHFGIDRVYGDSPDFDQ